MFLHTRLRRAAHGTVWSTPFLFLLPLLLTAFVLFNPMPVADLNPDGDSFPDFMTPIGDQVYFYANTGQAKQLFIANQQGATQLTSLASGTGNIDSLDFPAPIGASSTSVFFVVDADGNWAVDEVWRTDGTPAGTRLVMRNSYINTFYAAPDGFYVLADDGNGDMGIWYGDGSEAGAKLLQGGFDDMVSSVYELGVFDGQFYFAVSQPDSPHYFDLWRADANRATLLASTTLRRWVTGAVYQNALYIADGYGEVLRLPAGSDTPVMWQDGSVFYGYVSRMYAVDDRLYLIDWDTSGQYKQTLWRYDGAAGKLEEIVTYTRIGGVTGMGDSVYFDAEQYTEDGTRLGGDYFLRLPLTATKPTSVSPVFTIPGDKGVGGIETDGDLLYMQVSTPGASELWVSDGSAEGTRYVTTQITDYAGWESTACPCLEIAGGQVYFDRQDAATGVEPWRLERINQGERLYLPHLAR